MRIPSLLLVAASTACGTAFAAAQPADRMSIPVVRLSDGPGAFTTYSGFADSTLVVVRDSVVWRQVWRQINQPYLPQPSLPDVDFSREMVIVAALGAQRSSGFNVVIDGAELDSTAIEVAVHRTAPASGCPVEAVITQPVDLARIRASARPVRFRERSIVVPCDSP